MSRAKVEAQVVGTAGQGCTRVRLNEWSYINRYFAVALTSEQGGDQDQDVGAM